MAELAIFDLLTFPDSNNGNPAPFSAPKFTSKADYPQQPPQQQQRQQRGSTSDGRSASPPRKIQRLDAGSDSASSRSALPCSPTGPVSITINGTYNRKIDDGSRDLIVLQNTIRALLSRTESESERRTLQDTYEGIYSRCMFIVSVAGKGEGLYDRLKLSLEQCTDGLARELLAPQQQDSWLQMFVEICEWYEAQTAILHSLLTYLNQVHIDKSADEFTPTRHLAYEAFMKNIYDNTRIADRIWHCVTQWLNTERSSRSNHIDRVHIARLVKHLLTYKQYHHFERHYMDVSKTHFLNESSQKYQAFSEKPSEFFKHVQSRLEEEMARARDVMLPGSWEALRDVVERALLDGRLQWLAKGTLPYWIETGDKESLDALYKLYGRVKAIAELVPIFKYYIESTVVSIITNEKEDEQMIPRLVTFKSNAEDMITSVLVSTESPPLVGTSKSAENSFSGAKSNIVFVYALTDAFTHAFKKRPKKPAEMLAKHLDRMLRRGQGAATNKTFTDGLDKALALYRFTDDRDVFRTFYQRLLAKRLLLERSASNDDELEMLRKLKDEHDPEFSMSEDMFRDLRNSREYIDEYHSKLPFDDAEGRKLSATVLQRSAWPFTIQAKTIDLPLKLQKELDKFTEVYTANHANRKLDWDHALGTSTLTARFEKGTKDLTLNLYQTVVLLMFNDCVEIPFTDIKAEAGMDDAELRTTLQSLACGKKKVLKKVPAGRDVNDEDTFVWNAGFTDTNFKVHISSIQTKVAEEKESKRTQGAIDDERRYMVDAAVVRIMKARKEMLFERLKNETIEALKAHWNPNVDFIKRRIDALVEQDYIERDENDRKKYIYVA